MKRSKKQTNRILWIFILAVFTFTAVAVILGCSHTQKTGQASRSGLHYGAISNAKVNRFLDTVRPNRNDAVYHYGLGRHFQKLKKHRLAVQEFMLATDIDPQRAEAFNAMGVSNDYLGQWEQAVQCYRRAVELKPDFAAAYNNLGYSFIMQGKPREAVAPLQKANRLKADNALFQNNLALAFRLTGNILPDAHVADGTKEPAIRSQITENNSALRSIAAKSVQPLPLLDVNEPAAGPSDLSREREIKALMRILAVLDGPPSDRTDAGATEVKKQIAAEGSRPDSGKLPAIITGDHSADPAWIAPRIEIANGNGAYRMVSNLRRLFENSGFPVDRLANADHFNYPRTQIYYGNGQQLVACSLAQLLLGSETDCDLIYKDRDDGFVKIVAGHNIVGMNDFFSGRLRIQVANGNGITGAASVLTLQLREKGFVVAGPVNADHFGYRQSRIIYPEGRLDNARLLARVMPDQRQVNLIQGEEDPEIIRVVLGKNAL